MMNPESFPTKVDADLLAAIRAIVKEEINAEMKPFNDAMGNWKHLKAQVVFWCTAVLAMGGAIQAVQAIWGLIGPHLKID